MKFNDLLEEGGREEDCSENHLLGLSRLIREGWGEDFFNDSLQQLNSSDSSHICHSRGQGEVPKNLLSCTDSSVSQVKQSCAPKNVSLFLCFRIIEAISAKLHNHDHCDYRIAHLSFLKIHIVSASQDERLHL